MCKCPVLCTEALSNSLYLVHYSRSQLSFLLIFTHLGFLYNWWHFKLWLGEKKRCQLLPPIYIQPESSASVSVSMAS